MKTTHTPLMQQYHDIKCEYQDTLLFFQVGDFYELFYDDAKTAAAFLGIALTSRGKDNNEPIPLCGVPIHAKDHYLTKLIKGGFKVALCDQMEEAKPGTLVKRAVTNVLTPGTLTDSHLLDEKSASYLFSFYPGQDEWALVFGELLTAQLWTTIIPAGSEKIVESELARFFPDELIIPDVKSAKNYIPWFKKQGYYTTLLSGDIQDVHPWIDQFPQNIKEVINAHESLRLALYYFYAYLKKTQYGSDQLFNVHVYQPDDFLHLDAATQRNLELIKNNYDGGQAHTLFSILDGASTPMGSRMIKKWLQRPLIKKKAIEQRQDVIGVFVKHVSLLQLLQQLLSCIGDIERVVGRIALGRSQVHDYQALLSCLSNVPEIIKALASIQSNALIAVIIQHLSGFESLYEYVNTAFYREIHERYIIKAGFDKELDHMRELVTYSNQKILNLETEEQQQTGIQSLKIRYNNVHGYYIEVTNTHKDRVPDRYKRRQTLAGKERYTTAQLQQLESEIMHARNQIDQREKWVFEQVKATVAKQVTHLRKLAHALAHIDALHGFAKIAYNNRYTRPHFNENQEIVIAEGKHPIIAQNTQAGFIPNDTLLNDTQSLIILTGPNMGGKSTYLRQVALLCIMAQCGSFVPAKSCNVPILDRVFTRIGAGDNLAAGKSTFLVEMEETATICSQATQKSLVILDEVGRGTSTFDGLAIAQSVVEYIHQTIHARCLFATHYHELTYLSKKYPGIASFYASSKKTEAGIVFLYKIMQGVADGSFGIEVAKLAHLPPSVIERSRVILKDLSQHQPHTQDPNLSQEYQQLLNEYHALKSQNELLYKKLKIAQEFEHIDLENLSPKQAFDLLWRLNQKQP